MWRRNLLYFTLCCITLYFLGGWAAVGQQPVPVATELCTPTFYSFGHHPALISNAIKACLDDVSLSMQRTPNARLFIIGHSGAGEPARVAAQRVVNVMHYLTADRGVMAGQIVDLFGGSIRDKSVTIFLVPANAGFTKQNGAVAVPKGVRWKFCDLYSDGPYNCPQP